MNIWILITIGVTVSVLFHFIGVYAGAKKIVWFVIVLLWALGIDIATSEIKPKGYREIELMRGRFADTDKLIEQAGDKVSLYELIGIKKSYFDNGGTRLLRVAKEKRQER